jgi:hypothetical protein
VHPDIYRDLARQHHDELDREAARASLAAVARGERDDGERRAANRGRRLARLTAIRIGLLAMIDRGLLALERRVARAMLDAHAADEIR